MKQNNKVSFKIDSQELLNLRTKITELKEQIEPYLIKLSVTEKMSLPKMGDKSLAFVKKSLEYCHQNPSLVPQYIDVNEFKIDVEAVEILKSIEIPLAQILEQLHDTVLLSGSEALQAALLFYNSIRGAKKSNIDNASMIYDDLSNRFPPRHIKKQS